MSISDPDPHVHGAACGIDPLVPGCGTGPAGRLRFVLTEGRSAWRSRRAARHTRSEKGTP